MKKFVSMLLCLTLALTLLVPSLALGEAENVKPRTIVTTDLECDDMDSMMHLLLYANDIEIDKIVVSASQHHWTGDGEHKMNEIISRFKGNGELTEWRPMEINWVTDLILNEYASVYPNLVSNDPDYPTPGELAERVKIGNILFEDDYRFPTEGSDAIKESLLDDDERTIYLEAWGGANTIARALLSIEEEYKGTEEWDAVYQKVCKKGALISFGDQDYAYEEYIAPNWPDMTRLYCVSNGVGYASEYFVTVPYRKYFRADWLTENIKFGHGALMSKYLLFGDGTYYEGETPSNQFGYMSTLSMPDCWLSWMGGASAFNRYDYISEGDSPCWMFLIPVGLRGLENNDYGTWGGRLALQEGRDGTMKVGAVSEFDPSMGAMNSGYSVHRWLPAFMNDWAARADWCVNDYAHANHEPVVHAEKLDFAVAPGTTITLKADATDPDGDALSVNWWVYKDACKYQGNGAGGLDVWAHDVSETSFTVPADAQEGDLFNIVFEATDDGEPALTRYAQAIITVVAAPAE